MSRPFSYNDENFTVMGNILVFHISLDKAHSAGDVIATIPPAIADRLIQKSFYSFFQRDIVGYAGGTRSLRVNSNNEIYIDADIGDPPSNSKIYFIGVLVLKDI